MIKPIDNMIINTSVKPSYFDDGYTYMELIGELTQKIIECINSCNLSEEEVKNLIDNWNKLIKDVDGSKTIIERLELLIAQGDLQESTHDDIDKMFDNSQSPSTPDGVGYASNTDINSLF